jgi:hypothetical protein
VLAPYTPQRVSQGGEGEVVRTMKEDCVRALTSFSVIQACPSESRGWRVLLNVRPRALSWGSPPSAMGAPSMGASLTAVSSLAAVESCGSTVKKDEEGIVLFQQTNQTERVSFSDAKETDQKERCDWLVPSSVIGLGVLVICDVSTHAPLSLCLSL